MHRTDSRPQTAANAAPTGRDGTDEAGGAGPASHGTHSTPTTHGAHAHAAPPAATEARGAAERSTTIMLQSLSLGIAALGGAWQAAATDLAAPVRISDVLYAVSALIWLVLVVRYLLHTGNRWHNLRADLRHPAQGFAVSYIPIIGMLMAGHLAQYDLGAARWVYAVFLVLTGLVATRLVAHWLADGVTAAVLHPGFLLPISSGPFIASAMADALGAPMLGWACFAVGVFSWLSTGTVILGRLMTGGALQQQGRPALTVLVIPPATGGIAWLVARGGHLDQVGYGFAGVFVFTLLVVVFMLPAVRQPFFHLGFWVFGFPVAASTQFSVRWLDAARFGDWRIVAWAALAAASVFFAVLITATVRYAVRGDVASRATPA